MRKSFTKGGAFYNHYQKCLKPFEINQEQGKEELNCRYCGVLCKNKNSLAQHEIRCNQNPDAIPLSPICQYGHLSWNKGLTKDTSESIRKGIDTYQENFKKGLHKSNSHPHTKETKERISNTMSEKGLGGLSSVWVEYKGVKLQSSYELITAQSLDEYNIQWERCTTPIAYIDNNNQQRNYVPDFYLPEYDVYLDPKNDYLINNPTPQHGFTDKQKIEWVCEQNNIQVLILDERHLKWPQFKDMINQNNDNNN